MKTGTIEAIRWTFDDGVLTLEPVNGKEGNYNGDLSYAIKCLYQETKEIKTKGILHFIGASLRGAFSRFSNLKTADLSGFETSQATDIGDMFGWCDSLEHVNLSSFDTSNVTEMDNMFFNCRSLVELDVSNFDTSKVASMQHMFHGCSLLTNLDLSNFDTSKVTYMDYMFCECFKLTDIDVSHFNTDKVIDMSGMFDNCFGLTNLDVSNFNTNKVTNLYCMFSGCRLLTSLDLSNFDTSKVTNFRAMFSECYSLKELNISNFQFKKSVDVYAMFSLTDFQVLNMENIKSDVDFCLTELSVKNHCHLIVPKEIEELAKQVTNPSILVYVSSVTIYHFNKAFIEKVITALDVTTRLDFKNDLVVIKKNPKKDLTLALYKATELARINGHTNNADLTAISAITEHYGMTVGKLRILDQKQVIDLFNKTGLASDINAYLNGVPLEDILA